MYLYIIIYVLYIHTRGTPAIEYTLLPHWHVFKSTSTPVTHVHSLSSQESTKCLREGVVYVDTVTEKGLITKMLNKS